MKKEDLLQPAVVVLLALEFILIVLICLYWWKLLEFSWQVFEKVAGQVTWSNWFMKFFEVDQVRAGMFLFGASMSIGSMLFMIIFFFTEFFANQSLQKLKWYVLAGNISIIFLTLLLMLNPLLLVFTIVVALGAWALIYVNG